MSLPVRTNILQSDLQVPATSLLKNPQLIVLLLVFLALALAYSFVVPLFEGPDEDDHFRFAVYLADHRFLPVQQFQPGGGEAGHQGWQPPLYYALAALAFAPVDTSDFVDHLWRNPAAALTGDRACCGRNQYFHMDSENFPFTRTTLAVHLARGITILFGLLTVASLFLLTLTLYPGQIWLATATTAFAVLNPSFLYASALVSNDVPLAALCTLTLLLMAKLLTGRTSPTLKNFLIFGLIIALGILVKTTALGLVPLALLTAAYLAWRARQFRLFLISAFGILAPIIALTGWWFVRNQILYGDPFATRLIYVSAIFPRESPLTLPELFQINLPWLWQTFWGGPTPGDFPQTLLWALGGLVIVGALGMIHYIWRHWERLDAGVRVTLALMVSWLALIFLAQLQFIRTSGGTDQGRYLFPAIASFALFFAIGWSEILFVLGQSVSKVSKARVHRALGLLTCVVMFALSLFALFALAAPAYAKPSILTEPTDFGKKVDFNFGDKMALRGSSLSAKNLSCGDQLDLTLYWNALAKMHENYRIFVQLVDAQGRFGGNKDVIPYAGAYPTVYWKPGDWVKDIVHVPVNHGARIGSYSVIVGLYPFGQPDNRMNIAGSGDDFATLDSVKIDAPPEGCP